MPEQVQTPIAIVGMASLFPKAPDLATYWRNILGARDCIADVPAEHSWKTDDHFSDDPAAADRTWCTRGGFLDKLPFDPIEFGIPPNMLESIDTTQLLSLLVAREALKDAGLDPEKQSWDRDRVSVILGITGTQELAVTLGARLFGPVWRSAMKRCGIDDELAQAVSKDISAHFPVWTEQSFPGLLGNVVAGRITNRFGLGGTNAVVDAACASSLAAMQYAIGDLIAGRSDVVLTGGADTLNDTFMFQCFTRTPAFSKNGDARPFDESSDGILIGEGIAMLALKRLADAERDGDRIYAVIKGLGSSSDGRYKSIYAPNSSGQAKALRRTYAMAGVSPASVELVEAHGTGTRAGDVAEIAGLKDVYADANRDDRWVALGSVKSQIGHTKSTAGAAGLVKAALALYHRVLPPTAKIDTPNPKMGFENSPFYLNNSARPWVRAKDHPRRAAVSAFGFGGSNFHALLEEYGSDQNVQPMGGAEAELFLFGASGALALRSALDAALQLDAPTLGHRSREVLSAWVPGQAHVLGFAATDAEDFARKATLAKVLLERGPGSKEDVTYALLGQAPKLGVVFPGQGSQYVEMGRDLAVRYPEVRTALDALDEHFRKAGRAAPSAKLYPPSAYTDDERTAQEAALQATEWAQPTIGAVSKGLYDLLRRFGVSPTAVAGHSYGELTALYAAGVLDDEGFFRASRVRGEAMAARDTDRGTMAAVSGPLDRIQSVLSGLRDGVVLANRNAPEQGVISGSRAGVAKAIEALAADGLQAKPLHVSAAFHSSLVADAQGPFGDELESVSFHKPTVPVYAGATAKPYPSMGRAQRKQLAEQITSPVDFVGTIQAMLDDGVRVFIECGPKAVLANLIKQIAGPRPDVIVVALDRHRHKQPGDLQFKSALARLATAGVHVDVARLLQERLPPAPPVAASKATVWLAGANFKTERTRNPPLTPVPARRAPAAQVTPIMSASPAQVSPAPAAPAAVAATRPAPAAAPVASRATSPSGGSAMSDAPRNPALPRAELDALLAATRETLTAFQQTQERTAQVHSEFLSAYAKASESFTHLFDTHARLVAMASGQPMPATQAALPSVQAALSAPSPAQSIFETLGQPNPSPRLASAMTATEARVALPSSGPARAASDLPPLLDARSNVLVQASGPTAQPAPIAAPVAARPAPAAPRPAPVAAKPAPVAPRPAPVAAKPAGDAAIVSAMLNSVADKTGYPLDMLDLSMDLESDLGVDSIKRVEILAAVQDNVPGLPELDNDTMSALRTLQEVVDYLAQSLGGAPAATAAPAAPAPRAAAQPAAAPQAGAPTMIVDAMLNSVAEKTGYPHDMLDLSMDLESDLGVDSIKRVEILAAVQDAVPGLPELDNDTMSALRTLQEVVDYLAQSLGGAAPAAAQPAAAPAVPSQAAQPAQSGGAPSQIVDAMLNSVAEKTGYPHDMLELSMDLESDLGVDSIKRVEILAAVQDAIPGLPELDNDTMSALRTLQEVIDYLAASAGGVDPFVVAGPQAPRSTKPGPEAALVRRTVRLLPAPPGRSVSITGSVAITRDLHGQAERLAKVLRARGLKASVVDPDWSSLDAVRAALPAGLGAVVHLAAAGARGDSLDARVRGAFLLAKATGPVPHFATVSAMGGRFGLDALQGDPLQGALAGLPKTLAIEWPESRLLALDIDSSTRAEAIADALLTDYGAVEVGLPPGGALVMLNALAPMPIEAPGPVVRPGGLVVVSGGARGVTAEVVIELAHRAKPSFLLLGRSPLPSADPAWAHGQETEPQLKGARLAEAKRSSEKVTPRDIARDVSSVLASREVRLNLQRLEAAGSPALYLSADIRDPSSVAAAVAQATARFGPVRGVVHGAGVLADKKLSDKTEAQFDSVFGTKVDGLRALLANVNAKDLDFALLFASVAGRYGNVGQCDYAMGNEALTHIALQLAQQGVRAKSICWGPWAAGMVTPELRRAFEARGVGVIPLEAGAAFAYEELARGGEAVEVVVEGPVPSTGQRDRMLDPALSPWLSDHAIDGVPVVPVALVLEWFSELAHEVYPAAQLVGLRGLQVLKGIPLPGPVTMTLRWEPCASVGGDVALALRLTDETGRDRYRAQVDLAEQPALAGPFQRSSATGEACPWTLPQVYRDVLFHGPIFQGIDEIVSLSDEGAVAWLKTSAPDQLGGASAKWQTDPLALDSALQLMLVWVRARQGSAALPCAVQEYRQFLPFTGRVACHLEMQQATPRAGRFKATFLTEGGQVIATMDRGEYAARPVA